MHQLKASKMALAACGFSALWSVQAVAQSGDSDAKLEQMQKQIQNLQSQVRDMKEEKRQQEAEQTKQAKQLQKQEQEQATAQAGQDRQKPEEEETADTGPTKKLNINGGVVGDYNVATSDVDPGQHDGGEMHFNHFLVGADGQYGDLSFAFEHRFSPNNFGHAEQYLHYGWAAYDFADHHQVKGGFIQVPFGNIHGDDVGYTSWWGNLAYYTGMADTQAAGLNYTYENGPWRADLAAFKNDSLGQDALYAGGPSGPDGYEQVNGGAGRLGYTLDLEDDDLIDVSLSARGGQLDVGNAARGHQSGSSYGDRWAISAAAMAELGQWTLHGQFVNFRYNIPHGREDGDGNALSHRSVVMQNYGGRSGYMPSRGQLYSFDVSREIPVNWGALENINIYDEYSYIHSDRGGKDYIQNGNDSGVYNMGSIHQNTVGLSLDAGPLQVWNELTIGKNDAIGFIGSGQNKQWQVQFNITGALYFDGDIIDK